MIVFLYMPPKYPSRPFSIELACHNSLVSHLNDPWLSPSPFHIICMLRLYLNPPNSICFLMKSTDLLNFLAISSIERLSALPPTNLLTDSFALAYNATRYFLYPPLYNLLTYCPLFYKHNYFLLYMA